MSANLDRLIKLAKRSGSTLIIHDEKKGDMVMMDLDSYEMMLDMQHDFEDCSFGNEDLYEMSEKEMLDKINRDIGIWRSYREEENRDWNGELLEEDLVNNPPLDPFEEDYMHDPEWHKAGDILTNRHSSLAPNFVDKQIPDYFVPDLPNFDEELDEEEDKMLGVDDSDDNLVYNTLGQEAFERKNKVPFMKHEEGEVNKEDLDSEPVFFEEPV
ncbi:MAG: hypothetical protein ACD_18C00291G0001 [uncultured bacterium]|nr:MAG: hypothetical protein ACD_18C00291G0001 [uncultured bacterium]OGH88991.1 MAG: hypothetical protein A2507_03080 [Candidatus Magasanikbacteria bacterium RIFOXYD12_FULL_33_17]HAO52185.1 hypothetical protein [Candidatus Magasanikbacteria bacterium]